MFSDVDGSYITTTQLVSLSIIPLVYGIYKISTFIYSEATSPLRDVPGPPSPSIIYGNFTELSVSEAKYDEWMTKYGSTIQFQGILGVSRLMTTDLKAIHHILFNSYDYPKPETISYSLRQLFGNGVLSVEGDAHKYQRKILNPAFGPQQLRELTEIFIEKATELRDIWNREIVKHDGRIECLSWMSRTTLDIIGLAGFNYNFNALTSDPDKNELMKSFSIIFKAGAKPSIIPMLKAMYPPLRFLPAPNDAERIKASDVMGRIGARLLKESKSYGEDSKSGRKDVLSVLVRANTMQDVPETQRMNDDEVMSQIPTFIIAGHETTSITMSWALYTLTQNQDIQAKLRQELSTVSTDNPTMDDLNALPYLDAFVREVLRLYPAVSSVIRVADKDDSIPLNKPFTDKKGVVRHEIRVRKGQWITVPIAVVNRSKSIWGDDAMEFKPERWANTPEAALSIPGVWANLMTFIGGPRACIGFRFSLVETKALLFTLVRAFEFDLTVPAKDIGTKGIGIQRPVLLTDPNNSNQMPLLVRPVSSDA